MNKEKEIKKKSKLWILIIPVIIILFSSMYSLKENEYGIKLQFNKIVSINDNAGLYFKIPFIQSVKKISKSIQLYDIRPSDVMTSDKKSMIADMYILWKVTNPTVYYQTLNANINNAKDRTGITVYNSVKSVISSMTQDEIIELRGEKLTQTITDDANPDIKKYGIEIVQAQLKSLDLPNDNKKAVYERMISERNNIAASYQAEGESKAKKIMNETDKEIAILMETLQLAYNDKDKADFYNYIRSLDSLKVSLTGKNKKIMLSKDSELAKILYGNGVE